VELSAHAIDRLQTYGIEGLRFQGLDFLSQNDGTVDTTHPTDERTVTNRRGGRWIFPNN
jgi:hypothetical protein